MSVFQKFYDDAETYGKEARALVISNSPEILREIWEHELAGGPLGKYLHAYRTVKYRNGADLRLVAVWGGRDAQALRGHTFTHVYERGNIQPECRKLIIPLMRSSVIPHVHANWFFI